MKNYTVKSAPINIPQLELEINIDLSMFALVLDEKEKTEVQIDNLVEFLGSRYSPITSCEEFKLNDKINYYDNRPSQIQKVAIEKIEELRQHCNLHASQLIKALPDSILEKELDYQGLNNGQIIDIQTKAEQESREWIVLATKDIKEQSQTIVKERENYIREHLKEAIEECKRKMQDYQVQLQAMKGEVKLPPFPQSPEQPHPQPNTPPKQPNWSNSSNQQKTPGASTGQNPGASTGQNPGASTGQNPGASSTPPNWRRTSTSWKNKKAA